MSLDDDFNGVVVKFPKKAKLNAWQIGMLAARDVAVEYGEAKPCELHEEWRKNRIIDEDEYQCALGRSRAWMEKDIAENPDRSENYFSRLLRKKSDKGREPS